MNELSINKYQYQLLFLLNIFFVLNIYKFVGLKLNLE